MYEIKGAIYWCTRLRMLEWLSGKGFKPMGSAPDRRNPAFSVWLFQNTPELSAAVSEFFTDKSK